MRKAESVQSGNAVENGRKRRLRRLIHVFAAWLAVLLIIAAALFTGLKLVAAMGKNRLHGDVSSGGPVLPDMEEAVQSGSAELAQGAEDEAEKTSGGDGISEEITVWKEGWVRYDGSIYEYNDDILTFLVMGIDKSEEVTESANATDGGQSDGLFLVIANPDLREIQILAVNRDTMTEILMPGIAADGSTMTTTAQIAVQHGFGDGREESCELTVEAVSKLLYGLPIHGYLSVNYGALPVLNDALGGIEVTMSQDLSVMYEDWTVGAVVTLKGIQARDFVQWRDTSEFESARMRLTRQKEYMTAFAEKAIEETKKDIQLPVTLYKKVKNYIVTDLSIDEITYLAGELSGYRFGEIYTLEGETKMGEKFEEFYPDRKAMRELIIRLFYREVVPD